MTDYMGDVEYLQDLAKRLGDAPENEIALAYVNAAIQAVWDLSDPEGQGRQGQGPGLPYDRPVQYLRSCRRVPNTLHKAPGERV